MIIDFLAEAKALLQQQNVPPPYEVTMTESLWLKLREELIKTCPLPFRERRRYMGKVAGFDVYIDDDAPPGQVLMQGKAQ